MAKRTSWFCCDSKMPQDPRLVILPDNDHRWTWLCLLGLEKEGELEGQDVAGFFHYCQINQVKFSEVLCLLQGKGMLDRSFRPVGFEEWQLAALKAERNKRAYQNAKAKNNSVGSQSVVSHQAAEVSTSESDTESDTDKKKKKADKSAAVLLKEKITKDSKEILEYLIQKTGRGFTNTKEIIKCLRRDKPSVDDCKLMIDFKLNEWKGTKFESRVDPVTPFRADNFPGYLDSAKAAKSPAEKPAGPVDDWGKPIPQWEIDMMEEMKQEDANG